MADDTTSTDDISALWGSQGEGVLEPVRPQTHEDGAGVVDGGAGHLTNGYRTNGSQTNGSRVDGHRTNGNGSHPAAVNGHGLAEHEDGVARLAAALASRFDVVRKVDLDLVRGEMERAFTQQLAVALYELLATSNDRSAASEERVYRWLVESEEAQTTRLTAAIEDHRRASDEMATAVQEGMGAALDRLATFQRDLRHEVGRLGDVVAGHGTSNVAPASDPGAGEPVGMDETLATLRNELATLREERAELERAVERWRGRSRGPRRRRRLG